MNTKNNFVNISKFHLVDNLKTQQIKDVLLKKKKNISYLSLRNLKDNLSSKSIDKIEKTPKIPHEKEQKSKLTKTTKKEKLSKKTEKENQSPYLNKSYSPILEQRKSSKDTVNHVKSRSFIDFKIFPKKKEEIIFSDENFNSFSHNSKELKDITNTQQSLINIELYDQPTAADLYENDPNVMVLKQLKIENEEELHSLLYIIEEKLLTIEKNKEILYEMDQEKLDLSQKYQDLIKNHSIFLQEIQGEIKYYQENNYVITEQINKNSFFLKNTQIDNELQNTQNNYFEIEKKLKASQEKNEEKSNNLFIKINALNEELTNYDDLLTYKQKIWDSNINELKVSLEDKEKIQNVITYKKSMRDNGEDVIEMKLKKELLLGKIKNLKENKEILNKNENKTKKKMELESLNKKKSEFHLKNQEILAKKQEKLEKLKDLQKKHDELASLNFKINEEFIEITEKNTELKKSNLQNFQHNKSKKFIEFEKFSKRKNNLNLKLKELFDKKLELEGQKTNFSKNAYTNKRLENERFQYENEIKKLKEIIVKQEISVALMMNQIKSLKIEKEDAMEMMDSLKLGIQKQKQILLNKIEFK